MDTASAMLAEASHPFENSAEDIMKEYLSWLGTLRRRTEQLQAELAERHRLEEERRKS